MSVWDGIIDEMNYSYGRGGPVLPTTENQYGVITDLLGAGEIQGLVGGLSGVYFNGVSLLDNEKYNTLRMRKGTVSVSGTSVTNANNLFADIDLTLGPRYLLIRGSGPTGNLNATHYASNIYHVEAGTGFIALPNGFINENYTKEPGTDNRLTTDVDVSTQIRIPGAGVDGAEYVGKITGVGTHSTYGDWAFISPKISTSLLVADGNHSFEIDVIQQISSISNANTATLTSAVSRNVTSAAASLSQAQSFESDNNEALTYENSYAFVRTGQRNQLPINKYSGRIPLPSSTFIIAPGTALTWYSGTGGIRVGGSSSGTFITPAQFNFTTGSLEEIDTLEINIEFPGGLVYRTAEESNHGFAVAEFQIILHYKNDASDTAFKTQLIHGNNYGGVDFINNLHQASASTNTRTSSQSWVVGTGNVFNYEGQVRAAAGRNLGGIFNRTGTGTQYRQNIAGPFIQPFRISLQEFQPLHDWKVEIRRLTPDAPLDYNASNVDNKFAQFVGAARIKTVQAGIFDKFSYPTTAYAVSSFAAEDFSSPPSRAYHLKGRLVKVPTNYLTREETGTLTAKYTRNKGSGADSGSYSAWDGSFRGGTTTGINSRKVYTDNPAWIFYDILTDKENGLGEYIQESDVDKYSLYQIARYCDELVPNGKGGVEPRFTCNVYMSSAAEAYKVIKDLATSFRSMLYWLNGEMVAVQDSPKEPVYSFTTGNVQDGIFSYSYVGDKARINQVNVTWNNPDEMYQQTVLTVENLPSIEKLGKIVPRNIVAFACTSEGQARRLADWHLKSAELETELVTFKTGYNAIFLRPGDIINVQDKRQYNFETSGRVSSGSTTTSINLDRTVTFPGGAAGTACNLYLIYAEPGVYLAQDAATINSVSYTRGQLLLETASGAPLVTQVAAANLVDDSGNAVITQFSENTRIEIKEITNTGTSASTITTSGAFTTAPAQDTVWAISREDDVNTDELKEYKVLGLAHTDEGILISAARYERTKYDEIDTDLPVETTTYIPIPDKNAAVPRPDNIIVEQLTTSSSTVGGVPTGMSVVISWPTPEESFFDTNGSLQSIPYRFLSHFQIDHNMVSGDLKTRGKIFTRIDNIPGSSTNVTVEGVSAGEYTVKVRSVNLLGKYSPWRKVTARISSVAPGSTRLARIAQGGRLSCTPNIIATTGQIDINATKYTYTPPSGIPFNVTSASSAQKTQSFSGLSSGNRGYLFFDASDTADPWKAVEVATDTTQTDVNSNIIKFQYVKEIGASNLGLTAVSGTVTTTTASTVVAGSGTSFLTDFYVGALILVTTNSSNAYTANSEYREVASIASNTELRVKNAFTRAFSGQQARKQSLPVKVEDDAILAEITNSSGVYSAAFFTSGVGEAAVSIRQNSFAFTVDCTSDGSPILSSGAIAGSGNEIAVFEGTQPIQYDGVGASNGTFTISAAVSNVTLPGSGYIVDSGSFATISNITGLTAEVGTVTFTITGKNTSGNSFSFVTKQTFTKRIPGASGRTVELEASKYVINYTTAGTESDSITLTATASGFDHITPHFAFYKREANGSFTLKQNFSSDNDYVIPDSEEPASGASVLHKVEVKASTGGNVLSQDSVSIYGVQNGSDAITGFLTNPSATVPSDNSGNVSSFSNAAGNFKVFVGGNDESSNSDVTFSSSGANNLSSISINSSTGAYTVGGMGASNAGSVNFIATIAANSSLIGGTGAAQRTITLPFTVSKAIKGDQGNAITGPAGLRTVQGYLYYEKTSTGAPNTPLSSTYTFSSGDIDGGGTGNREVLGLGDSPNSATNKWTNFPREKDPTSANTFWTIRYYGTESAANSSTVSVTYSNVVSDISFDGVVRFNGTALENGTGTSVNPLEASDVGSNGSTTIDGGRITTGSITSQNHSGTGDGSGFSSAGTKINLNNGTISAKEFRIDSSGNASFSGDLSAAGGTFSGSLVVGGSNTSVSTVVAGAAAGASANQSTNSQILAGNLTGSVAGTSATDVKNGAASGASALQDGDTGVELSLNDGAVGPIVIDPSGPKLYQGTGTFNSTNTGFYLDNAGNFSLKNKLSFNGSTLSIEGGIVATSLTLNSTAQNSVATALASTTTSDAGGSSSDGASAVTLYNNSGVLKIRSNSISGVNHLVKESSIIKRFSNDKDFIYDTGQHSGFWVEIADLWWRMKDLYGGPIDANDVVIVRAGANVSLTSDNGTTRNSSALASIASKCTLQLGTAIPETTAGYSTYGNKAGIATQVADGYGNFFSSPRGIEAMRYEPRKSSSSSAASYLTSGGSLTNRYYRSNTVTNTGATSITLDTNANMDKRFYVEGKNTLRLEMVDSIKDTDAQVEDGFSHHGSGGRYFNLRSSNYYAYFRLWINVGSYSNAERVNFVDPYIEVTIVRNSNDRNAGLT